MVVQRTRIGDAPRWLRAWHRARRNLWWCPPARWLLPDTRPTMERRGLVDDWPWD